MNTPADWVKYVNFEIQDGQLKRAKMVYERALSSSLEMENDAEFWLLYTNFIHEQLKDPSLVRAKFEQKLK